MNECFLIGKIIKLGDFRFIYGDRLVHKSAIVMYVMTMNKQVIKCIGFDEIADLIFRKDFKYVLIRGKVRTKGYVGISAIQKI